jgi:outer membrane protein TolC
MKMFDMRLYIVFGIVLLLSVANVSAQSVMSLSEAVSTALNKNYGIRIASEELIKLDNNVTPGNAGMLPVVNFDGSRSYSVTDVNQTFQDGRQLKNDGIKANSYSFGPRLEWTLFDGMAMFLELDRLDLLQEMGVLALRSQVEGIVAEVTVTYYDIARQQQLVKVLEESIDISRQRLKIAEDKFDVGSGARVEVLQAQVALNEDVSAWKNQLVILSNTRTRLNTILGIDVDVEYTVDDDITLSSEPLEYDGLRTGAQQTNPELLMRRRSIDESRLQTRIQQANLLPQVSANMSYNFTGSENSASFFTEQNNRGLNYGLTARVPLFDGFNRRRAVQNARIDEKIAELELEWSALEVESMLLQAWTDYANALELIELEEQNLLVSQENAAIALERFQLGTYTPVELREAQQALLNTENRLVSAKYSAKASETRLLLISGRLTADR